MPLAPCWTSQPTGPSVFLIHWMVRVITRLISNVPFPLSPPEPPTTPSSLVALLPSIIFNHSLPHYITGLFISYLYTPRLNSVRVKNFFPISLSFQVSSSGTVLAHRKPE